MIRKAGWTLALVTLAVPSMLQAGVAAGGEGHWQAQTSLYTRHFSPDPRHNNRQDLLVLERHRSDRALAGGATFRNSFRQRSTYLYVGREFAVRDSPFHLKLTGGLLHGYRGEYWDKIPLNRYGVAPALIPSAGISHRQFVGEVVLLGAAATMVTAGLRF